MAGWNKASASCVALVSVVALTSATVALMQKKSSPSPGEGVDAPETRRICPHLDTKPVRQCNEKSDGGRKAANTSPCTPQHSGNCTEGLHNEHMGAVTTEQPEHRSEAPHGKLLTLTEPLSQEAGKDKRKPFAEQVERLAHGKSIESGERDVTIDLER